MKHLGLSLVFLCFTSQIHAAGARADYDLDDDGLIEINDLADLDNIRNHLDGLALYNDSTGCPVTGCNGFELSTNLDFDTNGDGQLDANDSYWNNGEGWMPLGDNIAFTASFDGNGFEINNLMIDQASHTGESRKGLFGYTLNASIKNTGLTGALAKVKGYSQTGALIGHAVDTTVVNVYSFIDVNAYSDDVGGLIGEASGTTLLRGAFANGSVESGSRFNGYVGGLIGTISSATTEVQNCVFSGRVKSNDNNVAGITGGSGNISSCLVTGPVSSIAVSTTRVQPINGSGTVNNSYWAIDSVGLDTSVTGGFGATLAQLACPTTANDQVCAAQSLYVGWDTELDPQGQAYWDFGGSTDLPAIVINGRSLRDSDNDGVLDNDDAFPQHFAASVDQDGDGAPERWHLDCDQSCADSSGLDFDAFPNNPAAAIDKDLDGLPDVWNPISANCDQVCIDNSGLTLDSLLNDSDNDNLTNDIDDQDFNSLNNGPVDADADSDGLIDIATLEQLNAIRFNLSGQGLQLSSVATSNSSGCPGRVDSGVVVAVCRGYELLNDLDFDTNSDGVLDSADSYWDNGSGWMPIGAPGSSLNSSFTGLFEGNGFEILNLMSIRSGGFSSAALFAYTRNATIQNLGLTGKLSFVQGADGSAALVGYAQDTHVEGVYSSVTVHSSTFFGEAGGLIATAMRGTLRGVFVNARIDGQYYTGGLTGSSFDVQIQSSHFSGYMMTQGTYVGGLTGRISTVSTSLVSGPVSSTATSDNIDPFSGQAGTASSSYWATDIVNLDPATSGGVGATQAELACPTAADDSTCAAVPLYEGWAAELDPLGNPYWDFGSNSQLPALVINGRVLRDSDNDGVLDADDAFPQQFAASVDSDADGAPDYWHVVCDQACIAASGLVLDNFPLDISASLDTDLDGFPEAWNVNCDAVCQQASSLTLDTNPDDSDNDGLTNDLDERDLDASNTGPLDADTNSNGLIDIRSLEQLDAIRFNLSGEGRQLTSNGSVDNSGCPVRVLAGKWNTTCRGYELLNDLDFDSNADGALSADDSYWNNGLGWLPIGDYSSNPFSGIFEGNGFEIRNLMIDRTTDPRAYTGLFSYVRNATIQNLGLTGPLGVVIANAYAGAIAGAVNDTNIVNVYSTLNVDASSASNAGGIAGRALGATLLRGVFSNGVVSGDGQVGGLIGEISSNKAEIQASLFSGQVIGLANYVGGLSGRDGDIFSSFVTGQVSASLTSTNVYPLNGQGGSATASYWATDSVGLATANNGGLGATKAELACPTAADNDVCAAAPLYVGWAAELDSQNNAYWDFGDSSQLPALVIQGRIFRDSDADGVLDIYVSDYVSQDAFPSDAAASIDTDGDGQPDDWNATCDLACQGASALLVDSDDDNDGVADGVDAFPLNAAISADTDGDGMPDDWNSSCDAACIEAQIDLGVVIDTDDDNNGVLDVDEPDNNANNAGTTANNGGGGGGSLSLWFMLIMSFSVLSRVRLTRKA